jgi:predicted Rossmann fold flavoprotein
LKIAVIGGGAAGFFGAITCAETNPAAQITLFEKSPKVLQKVKISGGGRCNVTNRETDPVKLSQNYPRGGKELRFAFRQFGSGDTVRWFESRGVKLKTEDDGRIFPATDNSQTIIDCLSYQIHKNKIQLKTSTGIQSVTKDGDGFCIAQDNKDQFFFDRVLICTGGNPNLKAYEWLASPGHSIIPPVPSLFTFNIPSSKYQGLQGVAVDNAMVKIAGIKNAEQTGALLITHWGLSGPAVLKTSAWEARTLSETNYEFTSLINWLPGQTEDSLRTEFTKLKSSSGKKIYNYYQETGLPRRLWESIAAYAGITGEMRWADLPKKNMNVLIQELINAENRIKGKTTFKEEFVTCGGISLKDVNMDTMESRKCPGIYFAGEVLDIDGITGGFNFQAAWTTGYIAGKNMGKP